MAAIGRPGLRKPSSLAELSDAPSSDFEEVRLEDLGPVGSEDTVSRDRPADLLAGRFLPSTGAFVSSIFGKNRTVPAPSQSTSESGDSARLPAAAAAAEAQQQDRPDPDHAEPATDSDAVREFEAATQKLGEAARDAASQVSKQLFGGAADAKQSLAKLAGDMSSWWATLDPTPTTPTASSNLTHQEEECQKLFGLEVGDELLEQFPVSLVQTYTCAHNTLTPGREARLPCLHNISVSFKCVLYITSKHVCISCPADNIAAAIPLASVASCSSSGQQLHVLYSGGSSLVLAHFQAGSLNSALGLIEHLSS